MPPECCRMIEYSETYQDISKCNLLGLITSTDILEQTNKTLLCLLDILQEWIKICIAFYLRLIP